MLLRIFALGSSAGGGDWPPLASALTELARRGHTVRLVGDEELARATAGTPLGVEVPPPGLDLASFVADWREEARRGVAKPMPMPLWVSEALPYFRDLARRETPDLVICQTFTLSMAIALRGALGVPVCWVHSTVYQGPGATRSPLEDYSPEAFAALTRRRSGLRPDAPADLTLIATDPELDRPPEPPPADTHWVGPLLWEPIQSVPDYLAEPGPAWVLITLSSHRQKGEAELARAALAAIAPFDVRGLLTLADADTRDELGPLPPNTRVERFVPHAAVLSRAALCVSHAGHGIVSKAMVHGVPMVLVPWDRDQPAVAGRAGALGIARVLRREQLSPEALAEAIRSALGDGTLRARCRAHGERLRARDAPAAACDLIERLAASGDH